MNTQYNWGRERSATLNAEALIIVALPLIAGVSDALALAVSQGTHLNSLLPSSRGDGVQTHLHVSRQAHRLKLTGFLVSLLMCLRGSCSQQLPDRFPTSASAAVTNPRWGQMMCHHQPRAQLHSTAEKSSKFSQYSSAAHLILLYVNVCCLGASFIFPAALTCQGGAPGELGALLAGWQGHGRTKPGKCHLA